MSARGGGISFRTTPDNQGRRVWLFSRKPFIDAPFPYCLTILIPQGRSSNSIGSLGFRIFLSSIPINQMFGEITPRILTKSSTFNTDVNIDFEGDDNFRLRQTRPFYTESKISSRRKFHRTQIFVRQRKNGENLRLLPSLFLQQIVDKLVDKRRRYRPSKWGRQFQRYMRLALEWFQAVYPGMSHVSNLFATMTSRFELCWLYKVTFRIVVAH